jgi:hypothetical protein
MLAWYQLSPVSAGKRSRVSRIEADDDKTVKVINEMKVCYIGMFVNIENF